MLAIPVPFVISMLLGLLALSLYVKLSEQAKLASIFLLLCAATTTLVGLRWTYDLYLLRAIQPIFASIIPAVAWYAFTETKKVKTFVMIRHLIGPAFILLSVFTQPWLRLPLDEVLTLLYAGYGISLLRSSNKETGLIHVSFGNWEGVKRAQQIAGWMLIFSAIVDAAMSLDFIFNQGNFAVYILTTAHVILLPVLSVAVVIASISMPIQEKEDSQPPQKSVDHEIDQDSPNMSSEELNLIATKLDKMIREKKLYLDPELTLSRLSRKLGVPAKLLSIAINKVHNKNISAFINEYRIEHAKQALIETKDTITQIFMYSGFQTKSNFHREFSRVVKLTPSEYRKQQSKLVDSSV